MLKGGKRFFVFVIFIAAIVAINFLCAEKAYADCVYYKIEFYLDDGTELELISSHTVCDHEDFFDVPILPEQDGFLLSCYDALGNKADIKDGIYNIQEDLGFIFRYELLTSQADGMNTASIGREQISQEICWVSLHDDYGNSINEYSVPSGTHTLPTPYEKNGFITLGWSLSIDGEPLSSDYIVYSSSSFYAVYEYCPITACVVGDRVAVYDNQITLSIDADHEDKDGFMSYEWARMMHQTPVLVEDRCSLTLSEVNESGTYIAKAIMQNGKYSITYEEIVEVEIQPFVFDIQTPLFSKVYSQEDEDLIEYYEIDLPNGMRLIEVKFIREEGENAGEYDIIDAVVLDNDNIIINFSTSAQDRFVIQKADYDYHFSFIIEEFNYDGEEHMLPYEADLPEGLDLSFTVVGDLKSAGFHLVTAHFLGDFSNYNYIPPVQETMLIHKAVYNLEDVNFYSVSLVYNAQPRQVFQEGRLPEGVKVNYSIEDAVDVGTYYVTLTFEGDYKNYHPIPSRQETITIIPKTIVPLFNLPENMVYDGEEKTIDITAEGIYERDEVVFTYTSSAPLITPGYYEITAKCNSQNYILYNNSIIVEIYKPYVENSGREYLDIKLCSENGIENNITFKVDSVQMSENILKRLGQKQHIRPFGISIFAGEQPIEAVDGYYFKLAVSSDFNDERRTKLYYYNADKDKFERIDISIEDGFLMFSHPYTECLVLTADKPLTAVSKQPNFDILNIVMFEIFILIVILIALLVYFMVSQSKDKVKKKIVPPPKPLIEPLSPQKRAELYKKIQEGSLVDWELNRDLPLYSEWRFDDLNDDINR